MMAVGSEFPEPSNVDRFTSKDNSRSVQHINVNKNVHDINKNKLSEGKNYIC